MKEEKEATEVTLSATMTVNGREVPMTATVDLLEFRKADAEAIHQLLSDDDAPPTLRETRRRDHLGTENHVRRSKYWRGALGTIVHAAAFLTLRDQASPWTLVQSFTHYVKGDNKDELPEVEHLNVPGEEGIDYSLGVALAVFQGVPVEVKLWVDRDGDANIRLSVAKEHQGELGAMMEHLEDATYAFLQGRVLDGHFNLIDRASISSEDVLLDEAVMKTIQRHIIDYRRIMPAIAAAGESPSRGLLMGGPPGCGKTSATRYIVSALPEVTFVIVTGTTLQRDGLRSIWRLVRKTNAMLILEDIDCMGSLSRDITDHPLLNQLLELLDGVEGSGCCTVLATTNHVDRMDPALTSRPGRFDRVIQVGPPSAAIRRELLRRTLHRYSPASNLDLDVAVRKTEGFTGAYVSELAKSAWIEAMHHGETVITSQHLDAALNDVTDQFKRALENHRSSTPPPTASSIGGWE